MPNAIPYRPRVLHLITRMDPGGAATSTRLSVDRLRGEGFDTALGYGRTLDGDGAIRADLSSLGVPAFYLACLVRDAAPVRDLVACVRTLRLIAAGRYDLVHTHCSKAGAVGRLAALLLGIPVVHTAHGHIFYGYFGRFRTGLFVAAERWLARRTDRLISLTDRETEDALRRGIGRIGQYCTIPSGVPLADFTGIPKEMGIRMRADLGIPGDAVLFVSVGRLVPVKGFGLLLRAFATVRAKAAYLVIVGDGEDRAALQSEARALGLGDRVRFAGHQRDVRPALSAADAFALASRNEGMGRALVEAMASGLPVIGADAGGIPALIEEGRTGLLFRSGDADALGSAMSRLAAAPELRRALGARAARSVYPRYDQASMVGALAALYREVLNANSILLPR